MHKHIHRSLAETRKLRIRGKLRAQANEVNHVYRPRLTIFRSNKFTYLQVIDDQTQKVLASCDTRSIEKATGPAKTKMEAAIQAAQELAEKLKSAKVTAIALDRGPYRYHGRIRAIADALRAGKVDL